MQLPPRVIASLDLAGTVCDGVGGLYLAYDLFGRHAGFLGVLTRAVTYGFVLAVPTWLLLGPSFGAIAGFGLGALVAYDQWRLARLQRFNLMSPLSQSWEAGFVRGVVMGLAAMPRFGVRFGLVMGGLTCLLLSIVYGAGWVPTFHAHQRHQFRPPRHVWRASIVRGAGMGVAAAVAASMEHVGAALGLEIGALVAASSVAVAMTIPHVEWWVENAPDRFFVMAALALLFVGLVLDTIPPAAVLLR